MVGSTGFMARLDDEIAKAFAYEVEPRGCLCPNNGGGDCEWCLAYKAGDQNEKNQSLHPQKPNREGRSCSSSPTQARQEE